MSCRPAAPPSSGVAAPATKAFVPLGQLPPFTPVQAVRVLRRHGLVEVRLHRNAVGFINAARLAPGNAETAHQAFCAYNAGAEPNNAEVLAAQRQRAGRRSPWSTAAASRRW